MFHTVLALVMLLAVLLMLLGVNRLSHADDKELERERKLRRKIIKSDDVISNDSVFHDFLVRDNPKTSPQKHHHNTILHHQQGHIS